MSQGVALGYLVRPLRGSGVRQDFKAVQDWDEDEAFAGFAQGVGASGGSKAIRMELLEERLDLREFEAHLPNANPMVRHFEIVDIVTQGAFGHAKVCEDSFGRDPVLQRHLQLRVYNFSFG